MRVGSLNSFSTSFYKALPTTKDLFWKVYSVFCMALFTTQRAAAAVSNNAHFAYSVRQWCPISRIEDMQLRSENYAYKSGMQIDIDVDPSLMDFQEEVLNCLYSEHFYKPAEKGMHRPLCLYDTKLEGPVAVFKENGLEKTTVDFGDLLAYKLDYNGHAKVPQAVKVNEIITQNGRKASIPKGVFVKWIQNTHDISNIEEANCNKSQRQIIALMDMRLGNSDRNFFNFRVDDASNVYPIDHDTLFSEFKLAVELKATYRKESLTKEAKNYIRTVDIQRDAEILRSYKVDGSQIDNLVIRTVFLKLAMETKWPFTVGDLEDLILNLDLPSNCINRFIDKCLFGHPLVQILRNLKSYEEKELKDAFIYEFYRGVDRLGVDSYMQFFLRTIYTRFFS